MAQKLFLTNVNLHQNQLQKAVVETVSSTPSNDAGIAGQIIYNTTDKKMYQHNGTEWVVVGRTITYDSAGDKVVVSVGGTTEKQSLVNIVLGSQYTPVTNGLFGTTDNLGTALHNIDQKLKEIVTTGGEPNVIEAISVGGANVPISSKVAEIPTASSSREGTLTAANWTTFNNKYDKPSSGIPETDLATEVQTSLGLADTSVQPSDITDMQVRSNLVTAFQSTPDNTHYPSEKLLKDQLDTKQNSLSTQTAYSSKGSSTKVAQITTNTLGQVTNVQEVAIDFPSGSGSVTGDATTFVKSVSLSGHTLSGTTQSADTTLSNSSTGIPTSAAVRDFVNSSINALAAYYITSDAQGNAWQTKAALTGATTYYSGGSERTPSKNDYAVVLRDETIPTVDNIYTSFTTKDEYFGYYVFNGSTYTQVTSSNVGDLSITPGTTPAYEYTNPTTRYVNTSDTSTPSWSFQYIVNESPFTAAQLAAIDSGIDSTKVSSYNTHVADNTIHVTSSDKTKWNQKLDPVNAVTDDTSKNFVSAVTQSTDGQISVTKGTLANVATSGSYNDLSDTPSIPLGTVTSVQVQAADPILSSTSSSQTTSLNTTISLSDGYGDTQNPYGDKTANTFLAAPSILGTTGVPSFRPIVGEDLASLFIDTGVTFTFNTSNSALTPSNGIVRWQISGISSPITNTSIGYGKAIASVRETATGDEVMADIIYSSTSITILMNSTSNISANTYTCVFSAPLILSEEN